MATGTSTGAPAHADVFATTESQDRPGDAFDIKLVWRVVRQNKWRALLYALVFGALAYAWAQRSTPIYEAQTKLVADLFSADVSASGSSYNSYAMMYLFFETQRNILTSRSILSKVVDRLDLVAKRRAKLALEKQEAEAAMKDRDTFDWRLWLPAFLTEEEQRDPTDMEIREGLISQLMATVKVVVPKESQVIEIGFESSDPQLAADIVNEIAEVYRVFGLASRQSTAQAQTEFLDEQLQELRNKVNAAERKLDDYQRQEGMIDTESRQQIVTAQLAGLSEQLVSAEAKRSEAEVRFREVERLRSRKSGYDSLVAVLQNDFVGSLRRKQAELAGKVSELSERYGEKHPKMKAARSELKEANRGLEVAIEKVVGSLEQEYLVAAQQERKVRGLISERKQEIQALSGKGFQQAKLERELANAREVYEQFLSRSAELGVTGDYDVSNIRVIDRATVPSKPIKPNKGRMIGVGIFLGLLFGFALGYIRELTDSTFRVMDQVEAKLRLPGLGIAPFLRAKGKSVPERMVEESPRSPFSEAINHIRTGVLFSSIDKPPQVILVTSSVAAEGKTTLACNLAQAFGQVGRTLLIEADLRKPRLANLFDLPGGCGVTDLAVEPDLAKDCIKRLGKTGETFLLPAGTQLANPLEFLSSDAFRRLIDALKHKFTYIVIDSAPVLPVSDSLVIGREADAVVLAIRADSTSERVAKESVKRLMSAHVRPAGAVLTLAHTRRMAAYGGRYYETAYNYGYAYGDGKKKAKPARLPDSPPDTA